MYTLSFRRLSRKPLALAVAASALAAAQPALAFPINTGNDDISIRLDTTLRLNAAIRAKDREARWADNSAYDEGDFLFDKHDFISQRIDLISEFDLAYKDRFGVRVSGAGWYDAAYGDNSKSNPIFGQNTSYPDNRFTSDVTRWYAGPSGEILDAFGWVNFSTGGVDHNLKAGRFALLWGESLFGNTHGISNSQTANDGRKGLSSPGASAKETALPMSQVAWTAQLTDNLQLQAQYLFEWRPNRLPEGGTFFGGADSIQEGPPRVGADPVTGATTIARGPSEEGDKGDFGVALRWRPRWLDGTVGFYYRDYDEKNSWTSQLRTTPALDTHPVYAQGVKLYGISLAKSIGGAAFSGEISMRKDGALNSTGTPNPATNPRLEGARGDTLHALLNVTKFLPSQSWYDTSSLSAELSWNHLRSVTRNPELYNGEGYAARCIAAPEPELAGCSTKNYYGLGVSSTTTWAQVLPGWDFSLPLFVSWNLKGNGASLGGGNEGFNTYKAGINAVKDGVHNFDFAYQWWSVKTSTYGLTPAQIDQGLRTANGAAYTDKGFFALTYTYAF